MADQTNTEQVIADLKASVFGTQPAPTMQIVKPEPEPTTVEPPQAAQNTPQEPTDTSTVSISTTINEPSNDIIAPNELKEKLGYEDWETAAKELAELRNYKTIANPLESLNDESKKIYEALRAGKSKEVKSYLEAQEMLQDLETKTPEQQLKLYIRLTNPLFDNELIDDEYNSTYGIDEEKLKDDLGDINPLALRKEKLKVQQRIQHDLEKAQETFSKYRTKIELPAIQPQVQAGLTPEDEQKIDKQIQDFNKAVNDVKYEQLGFKVSFNDEANKMNFDANYTLNKEGFENAKKSSQDYFGWIDEHYGKDGKPFADKLVSDIYLIEHKGEIFTEIIKQTVNATKKWFLEKNTSGAGGVQKNFANVQPDEITQLKNQIFGKAV